MMDRLVLYFPIHSLAILRTFDDEHVKSFLLLPPEPSNVAERPQFDILTLLM